MLGKQRVVFRNPAQLSAGASAAGTTGVGRVDPQMAATDPQAAQAAVTRGQWRLFEQEFKPHEDKALSRLLDDGEAEVRAAGAQVNRSYGGLAETQTRQLSRYGMRLDGDVGAAVTRRNDLMQGLDVARAENSTRDEIEERRLEGLSSILGIMRGVNQSAGSNLNAAAGMASDREIAGMNNRAQASSARRGLMGSVAGMGLAAAIAFA